MRLRGVILGALGTIGLGLFLCAGVALWFWAKAGQFRDVLPGGEFRCRAIAGIFGGEDIEVDGVGKRAFISADDRRATLFGRAAKGGLYSLDVSRNWTEPVAIAPKNTPADFHPHGLSIYSDATGAHALFVINHGASESSVLIYSIAPDGALTLQDAITDPALFSPNDLVAVGPRQFYVTNTTTRRQLPELVAEFLGFGASGTIAYFDGHAFTLMADGLSFPNGIAVSKDGTRLHVAEFFAARVAHFARDPKTNVVSRAGHTSLRSAPDNITNAPDGALWVGAHPHVVDLLDYLDNPDGLAPSEVLKLTPAGDGFNVKSIWLDDSRTLAASSVATVFGSGKQGEKFLVGSVADDHILTCKHKWDE